MPRDIVEVNAFNVPMKKRQNDEPKPKHVTSFELICTSNGMMDLKNIIEEETRIKDARRQ